MYSGAYMTPTYITSSSNPLAKRLRKLATQAKFRADAQQTLAHGPHLVESYLQDERDVELFYFAKSASTNPEILRLMWLLEDRKIRGLELPDSLYESLSDVHAKVGLSIVIPVPAVPTQSTIARDAVLLDSIQDPGNLGTILRTARATGVEHIYLSADSTSAWAPKALRAGMGAQFGLKLHEHADLASIIGTSTVPVYATTLAPDSVSLYDAPLSAPVAWIFGNEGRGVNPSLQQLTHKRVHLPQVEGGVESLNVSAAAAVCLYERFRQQHHA